MELTSGVDWISATYPADYNQKWQVAVLPFEAKQGIVVKSLLGYQICERFPTGALMCYSPDNPRMGTHVIYSSQALASAELEHGTTQEQIIHYLSRFASIVRLDVRLDVFDVKMDILKLHRQAKQGFCLTKAKVVDYIESAKVGNEKGAQTCYVGSQQKRKKLLRVYDKGAQLNLERLQIRCELETHGKIAQHAANRLKTGKLADYPQIIRGMIKDYACWPYYAPLVQAFADTQMVHLDVPTHIRGNTVKWLLDTVAPTLAREVALDSSLLSHFLARVYAEIAIRAETGSN